jgi:hypothetical protein
METMEVVAVEQPARNYRWSLNTALKVVSGHRQMRKAGVRVQRKPIYNGRMAGEKRE